MRTIVFNGISKLRIEVSFSNSHLRGKVSRLVVRGGGEVVNMGREGGARGPDQTVTYPHLLPHHPVTSDVWQGVCVAWLHSILIVYLHATLRNWLLLILLNVFILQHVAFFIGCLSKTCRAVTNTFVRITTCLFYVGGGLLFNSVNGFKTK